MTVRGWKRSERESLLRLVAKNKREGLTVRQSFIEFAKLTGRKPDSVRNFYYAYLNSCDCLPIGIDKKEIEVFKQSELKSLVSKVLQLQAIGYSMRGAIGYITGDKKKRLRYQNKLRSLIKAKSPFLYEEMEKNKRLGRYYDPFMKKVVVIERGSPMTTLVKTPSAARYEKPIKEYFREEEIKQLKLFGFASQE